jgi:regulator of protease activity HflC (stomatin/prohibitin superfamily)
LNNTCQYAQDIRAATEGNVREVQNTQNLAHASEEIARTLESDLNRALGGPFFENVRFTLNGVSFERQVQSAITQATTARTEVATRRLQAQQAVEQARGRRRVAAEEARAIRATENAYANNPAKARIDALVALCGQDGCDLTTLGGSLSNLVGR